MSDARIDGRRWERTVLRTPWLTEHHDLGVVLAAALAADDAPSQEHRVLVA